MAKLQGRRALITGASSGLGAEFARILAARGCSLILVARRQQRLEALAAELRSEQCTVEVMAFDLSRPESAAELFQAATRDGRPVDILINNAGFGQFTWFSEAPWRRHAEMLQLNVVTLAELTHLFLRALRPEPQRRGYVLNVASIAAYAPVPFYANYAASKAYVRSFSEALRTELRGTNVSVTCLSPGATRTEFQTVANQPVGKLMGVTFMSARSAATAGIRAMLRGKSNVLPGVINRLTGFFTELIPRTWAAAASILVIGKPDRKALTTTEPTPESTSDTSSPASAVDDP
jgi:short-subunit dehydrogenase